MRLREFAVGSTVTLKGAGATDRPFFIGSIDENGYRHLWATKQKMEDKELCDVIASGDHEVMEAV